MRHQVAVRKLGKTASHRRAMLRNMVTSLFLHERIRTTTPKAKVARRFAERMITFGKKGTLHARRQAARFVNDETVLKKLFDEIAPSMAERNGGYTRIIRLGTRKGDAADTAILELVGKTEKSDKPEKKKHNRKSTLRLAEYKMAGVVESDSEPQTEVAQEETEDNSIPEADTDVAAVETKEAKPKPEA